MASPFLSTHLCLGRSFETLVDPVNLEEGAHFTEIVGYDADNFDQGPLFCFPITVIKSCSIGFAKTKLGVFFKPASIFRKFLQVPAGSSFLSMKFYFVICAHLV